jgi:hypothetical protein
MYGAENQELCERRADPTRNMTSNSTLAMASQSLWSVFDQWPWHSPDVMDSVLTHFALDSG